MQTTLRMALRTLVERPLRWLINNRRHPIDTGAAVAQFSDGVQGVQALPDILTGRDKEALEQRLKSYQAAGVPDELATAIAARPAYAAPTIVHTALQSDIDVLKVAELHFTLGQRLGLDRLLARSSICRAKTGGRPWLAPACATTCMRCMPNSQLEVLNTNGPATKSARDVVIAWEKSNAAVPSP